MSESALARISLFAGLDEATLRGLEVLTWRRSFSPGELIMEEGRTGNGLLVVLSGEVEVFRTVEGSERILRRMGPGEPFGEMALLGEWPRTASVRALQPTECLGMDRWVFLTHLSEKPALAVRMLQILAQRLANTPDRLEE
jgi:CRP-like cAMP-binding protein